MVACSFAGLSASFPIHFINAGQMDYVFEVFMMTENPVVSILQTVVGEEVAWLSCFCVQECREHCAA